MCIVLRRSMPQPQPRAATPGEFPSGVSNLTISRGLQLPSPYTTPSGVYPPRVLYLGKVGYSLFYAREDREALYLF